MLAGLHVAPQPQEERSPVDCLPWALQVGVWGSLPSSNGKHPQEQGGWEESKVRTNPLTFLLLLALMPHSDRSCAPPQLQLQQGPSPPRSNIQWSPQHYGFPSPSDLKVDMAPIVSF